MNDDARWFCCPMCQMRIGEIEPDGSLLIYPFLRVVEAKFVCHCGEALIWHSHPAALDRLVERVRRLRSSVGSPCGLLT